MILATISGLIALGLAMFATAHAVELFVEWAPA